MCVCCKHEWALTESLVLDLICRHVRHSVRRRGLKQNLIEFNKRRTEELRSGFDLRRIVAEAIQIQIRILTGSVALH